MGPRPRFTKFQFQKILLLPSKTGIILNKKRSFLPIDLLWYPVHVAPVRMKV